MTAREKRLSDTFVALADTLVSDFDVADLLYNLVERTAELFGADQVGLVLADPAGGLHVMAATSEATHLIELLQIQNDEGPCLDAYRTGRPVLVSDVGSPEAQERWPALAPAVQASGFRSVAAIPMRLRAESLGAINLFSAQTGEMATEELSTAQALADVASIGILQERAVRDARIVIDQLQTALNSRIVIEQAKGVVAQQGGIGVDLAFVCMRRFARDRNLSISETARRILGGQFDFTELPLQT